MHALVFNTQRWRRWQGEMMSAAPLIATVQRFFSLLEQRQIRYVLASGIALLDYVQGRNNQDLDVVWQLQRSKSYQNYPSIIKIEILRGQCSPNDRSICS